jgi:hypothetical protein
MKHFLLLFLGIFFLDSTVCFAEQNIWFTPLIKKYESNEFTSARELAVKYLTKHLLLLEVAQKNKQENGSTHRILPLIRSILISENKLSIKDRFSKNGKLKKLIKRTLLISKNNLSEIQFSSNSTKQYLKRELNNCIIAWLNSLNGNILLPELKKEFNEFKSILKTKSLANTIKLKYND